MRQPRDEALLRDMLAHARLAVAAVADKERIDLESDFILAAALERFIEVIGEAASKVSEVTKERSPQIPWREIVGMRNRLVHGYASVDHDIVWDVVAGDLAEVIDTRAAKIGQLLALGFGVAPARESPSLRARAAA
jgi:uncharacterized protein with HEPN domain